jgi:hypothetical protein
MSVVVMNEDLGLIGSDEVVCSAELERRRGIEAKHCTHSN